MCTSFIDSLEGAAEHLTQRANLAAAAKSPIERIQQVAESQGWRRLQLLSSAKACIEYVVFRNRPAQRQCAPHAGHAFHLPAQVDLSRKQAISGRAIAR
jgi:predicted dithiol-disulfide oxidoreductase (DUF899 family)